MDVVLIRFHFQRARVFHQRGVWALLERYQHVSLT